MRFLIVGDLHGKKPKIHYKNFDAIIAPGDFCSDELKKEMYKEVIYRLRGKTIHWYNIVGKKKAILMLKKSLNH